MLFTSGCEDWCLVTLLRLVSDAKCFPKCRRESDVKLFVLLGGCTVVYFTNC